MSYNPAENPSQPIDSDETKDISNVEKALENVIHILERTAQQCRTLETEAESCITNKDADGCKGKHTEKAHLIVQLPDLLSSDLTNVDQSLRKRISTNVRQLAELAQEMLNQDNSFGLGAFLIKKGSKKSDPNLLEELITSLK